MQQYNRNLEKEKTASLIAQNNQIQREEKLEDVIETKASDTAGKEFLENINKEVPAFVEREPSVVFF